jgi:hypothetical protein
MIEEGDIENGRADRAVEEAKASLERARQVVARSRSLLLGEGAAVGEPLYLISEADAGSKPASAAVQDPPINLSEPPLGAA